MKDIKIKEETKLVLGANPESARFAKPDFCVALKSAKCLLRNVFSVISPSNSHTYYEFDNTAFVPVALLIDASRISDKKRSPKAVAENRRVL